MPYEILEHTGDLRVKVSGKTLEILFSQAALGMMGVLKKSANVPKPTVKRDINISSLESTALLIDFLNEVLALSYINKEIYTKVNFHKFSNQSLQAQLEGSKVESFDQDIKAVTYHQAEIKKSPTGEFSTNLVFDI